MRFLIGVSIFLGLNALLLFYMYIIKWRRIARLREIAKRNGLSYSEDCPTEIFSKYRFLNKLKVRKRVNFLTYFNLIRGKYKGHDIVFFDFYYRWMSGARYTDNWSIKQKKTSLLILNLDQHFPELLISKKGFLLSIMSALGEILNLQQIKIEYSGFSKSFSIQTSDEAFAKKFCNEDMIDFLFENQDLSLEVENDCIALFFEPFMSPHTLIENLDRLLEIKKRMGKVNENA